MAAGKDVQGDATARGIDLSPVLDDSGGKSGATRRRLLQAAREAFTTKGYHGTTTRDIASRAGMSPAAMYIHFPSKQDVLFRLIHLGHMSAYAALRDAASSSQDPRTALRAAAYAFTHWHASNAEIGRIAQYEFRYLEDGGRAEVASVRVSIDRTIRDILEDGVAAGIFAVPDTRMTTLAILALSIDVVRWFPSKTITDPAAVASHYADIVDRMVSAGAWGADAGMAR